MPRNCAGFRAATLLFVALGINGLKAAAISVADQSAIPGQTTIASIVLAGEGQQISGLQFDLAWDSPIDVKVTLGTQLRTSTKLLYGVALDARTVRFIIAGQNGVLSDGEVLKLFVEVPGGASAGSAQIRFSNSAATDPSGNALALRSGAVNVQILGNSGPSLLPQTVLNAASLQAGALAPGEIITLFGASPANPSVLFNGTPGPVLYADSGQVNAIVPFGLDVSAPATVDLQSNGRSYLKGTITAARVAPAIFTQTGTGAGPGAILNQDYTLNSPANPAAAGSTIMVYGTGFGAVSPAAVDGQTVSNIASTVLPVTATIGGTTAKVVYAGAAPGLIAGAVQINVTIPSTLKTNPAAPLVLTISSISTPASVTVAIR